MIQKVTLGFLVFAMAACASSPPPEAQTSAANEPTAPAADTATKPSAEATKKHLAEHVTYPATREQILAACAQTPEFTTGEKRWFSDNLPEGTYESADKVVGALKL